MRNAVKHSSGPEKALTTPVYPYTRLPYLYVKKGDFDILWSYTFLLVLGHSAYLYAMYCHLYNFFYVDMYQSAKIWFWFIVVGNCTGIGVTAGAHRLWTHKSYEAKLPLRVVLMIWHCMAGQHSLYYWCRDHRAHHKFSDTDADPHNVKRGFFYSHIGWICRKRHPDFERKAAQLDFSDLLNDSVVKFQMDYYPILYAVFACIIPVFVPFLFWDIGFFHSVLVAYVIRYMTSLNNTWFVNSAAHMFGEKPYNSKIEPCQNTMVSFVALGEGYHNYHHVFPWDYRSHEIGSYFNTTKAFIDLMAFIGQAYNLKTASTEMIQQRVDNNSRVKDDVNVTKRSNEDNNYALTEIEYTSSRSL